MSVSVNPRPTRGEIRTDTSSGPVFDYALCVADATPSGRAARRQAAALTSGGGTVRSIAAPWRAWREPNTVWQLADGADLLVLGADELPHTILQDAPIPVLLSRWLPFNDDIAARILIVVDQAVDPDRAAEIAGALAARRGGEVSILPSLARSRSLQRSMAASRRIVLETSGVWPEVLGDELAREAAIPSAVRAFDPSLVVLPLGDTPHARAPAVSIARHLSCPVLAVPSPLTLETGRPWRAYRTTRTSHGAPDTTLELTEPRTKL